LYSSIFSLIFLLVAGNFEPFLLPKFILVGVMPWMLRTTLSWLCLSRGSFFTLFLLEKDTGPSSVDDRGL